MHVLILLTASLFCTAHAAPQFVTFKDGKIGVNFGGYHAQAGLGGLLTGNAAHGGLSASAGTPWGQNAAAGLGGAVDGRSSGFAYAGAQANPSVGASAALGGSAGEHGFIGSEAHSNGKTLTKTVTSAKEPSNTVFTYDEPHIENPATSGPLPTLEYRSDVIQKIKPPKKYSLIKNEESPSSSPPSSPPSSPSTSPSSHHSRNAADRTLMANANGDTTSTVQHFHTTSDDNAGTMIHLHRQRMRERRRLQQHDQDIQNELHQRRKSEHRERTRKRLNRRQHVVVRTKDIEIKPITTDVATQQYVNSNPNANANVNANVYANANANVNAVHSKRLIKNIHKSVNTETNSATIPTGSAPTEINVHYNSNPGALGNILNIPIGILRTIQESLTGVQVEKNISISG